jgi:hypothetical protein
MSEDKQMPESKSYEGVAALLTILRFTGSQSASIGCTSGLYASNGNTRTASGNSGLSAVR